MRYLLILAVYIALTAYCITDIIIHPEENPHGLPKILWIFVIILVPYAGAAAWFFLKYRRGRPAPPRPSAPDDDPDYLRWLQQQERRRKRGGEGA